MRDGALVLLWGLETDPPLAAVLRELTALGVPTEFADQNQVLDMEVRLNVSESIAASLRSRGRDFDLSRVTAAYLRPYDFWQIPAIASAGPQGAAWRHATQVQDIIASWFEMTPAFLVNRLDAMSSNNSKPYQSRLIHHLGFSVPETLITTDPAAAQGFWQRQSMVIYKSISGIRSRVTRLGPEHVTRLHDVSSCPTQFQRYIYGTEHRVHVVGDKVFACEVLCDADDYRYPGAGTVELRTCFLPKEIDARCRRLTAAMELSVAGIDLRKTPEGEWVCFEVNTSPAFTYYEEATNQPIARAIARLLAEAGETV
jgi:glutathione synthase/RimK-type ligase-like ATP-grasp enzyme